MINKKHNVDKISLVQIGDKIDDIILADGKSIFERYLINKNCYYYIELHYGNYSNKKSLIAEVHLIIGGVGNTVLVSSVKGDVLKNKYNNIFFKNTFCPTELGEYTQEKWKSIYAIVLTNLKYESTLIDYGGNFILGDEWFSNISYFCKKKFLLSDGKNRWLFDIEGNKFVTESSFEEIEKCPDNKHAVVTRQYESNVIDFEGNFMFNDWYNQIKPGELQYGDEPKVFYYVTYDTTTRLWNEDFKIVIDFDYENIQFKVVSKTYSEYIMLMKSQNGNLEFNILGKDLKPMFNTWLQYIDDTFFNSTLLFIVKSEHGYMIMDGKTIKPWDKCKIWVEDIVKLESLTSRNEELFAVKINNNRCFIIRLTSYPRVVLYCEEIKEDEYGTVYLTDNEKSTILKLFPHNSEVSRFDGDLLLPTYFDTTFIVRKDGKYNFCKHGSEGIYFYFTEGQWLDDVYCTDDRFVIIKRDGKYNYFDTTAFRCHFPGEWRYKDVEPAEETERGWVFRVMTDNGKWIEQ